MNGTRSNTQRPCKRERPSNKGAKSLNSTENEQLFSLLGRDSVSLAAGVVQLLRNDLNNMRSWIKLHTGIICLIKDFEKRAYFLRLYDVCRRQFLWQQMLYKNFRVLSTSCNNLLTFEGDTCVYGLNFSSDDEATNFKYHLCKRYEQERKTYAANRMKSLSSNDNQAVDSNSMAKGSSNWVGNTSIGIMPSVGSQFANFISNNKTMKKHSKEKRTKIRKEDISNPTNFQHKAHVGWDQDGGFSQKTFDDDPMDDSVRDLLKAAGENPDIMSKEDIDFTRNFLTVYQKLPQESANTSAQITMISQRYPPVLPAPHCSSNFQIHPPPPPPARREPISASPPPQRPLPCTNRPPNRPLPQPPAPVGSTHGYRPNDMPPPPPPPPPPFLQKLQPSSKGVIPPPPPLPILRSMNTANQKDISSSNSSGHISSTADSNVEESVVSISKPMTVNESGENENSTNVSAHDNMMNQIRKGATLKHVEAGSSEQKNQPISDFGGIAGALARALQERRHNIQRSDDSESGAESSASEWDTE